MFRPALLFFLLLPVAAPFEAEIPAPPASPVPGKAHFIGQDAGWLPSPPFAGSLQSQRKPASSQSRKEWEEDEKKQRAQTLELPKEPPASVIADARRLSFHVAPLSSKGLLSQQIRDGVRALLRLTRRASIVRIRAFVAGTGDMRRVQAVVSEEFTRRRMAMPVLTIVQVGALPKTGSQVAIEALVMERKPLNPEGLIFLAGQAATAENPLFPITPLMEQSLTALRAGLETAHAKPKDILSLTCYASSLDDFSSIRLRLAQEFPSARVNVVQPERAPVRAAFQCEAVARSAGKAGVTDIVLTGAQLGFGYSEADAHLAWERLGKTLEQAGSSIHQVIYWRGYSVSNSLAGLVRRTGQPLLNSKSSTSAVLSAEGLPSVDASFAIDAIALR